MESNDKALEHAESEIRRLKATAGQDVAVRCAMAYSEFLQAKPGSEEREARARLARLGFKWPEPSGAVPAAASHATRDFERTPARPAPVALSMADAQRGLEAAGRLYGPALQARLGLLYQEGTTAAQPSVEAVQALRAIHTLSLQPDARTAEVGAILEALSLRVQHPGGR